MYGKCHSLLETFYPSIYFICSNELKITGLFSSGPDNDSQRSLYKIQIIRLQVIYMQRVYANLLESLHFISRFARDSLNRKVSVATYSIH